MDEYTKMDHVSPPMNPHDALNEIDSIVMDLYNKIPDLTLIEFYYANLVEKTDFTDEEIKEWLEFDPTDEQVYKIYEYVEIVAEIEYIEEQLYEPSVGMDMFIF